VCVLSLWLIVSQLVYVTLKIKNKRKKKDNNVVLTYWSVVGIFYITMSYSLFLNLSWSFRTYVTQICITLAMIL